MNSEHPLPGVKTLGPFNSGTGEGANYSHRHLRNPGRRNG